MKKSLILMLVGAGILVGLVLSYVTYAGMKMTSGQKFCVSCHEMDPMVMSYRDDVHGGKGRVGAVAQCVDCHLPHDNLVKYIYTKARNGVVEGAIHFFGEPENIDWHEKRKHRDTFVFDNGCLECHESLLDSSLNTSSKTARKMHAHYAKLKGTDKEVTCASCHFDAGHKGMRNMLNLYKPQFELAKEKLEHKKLEVIKQYEKYGIKSHGE